MVCRISYVVWYITVSGGTFFASGICAYALLPAVSIVSPAMINVYVIFFIVLFFKILLKRRWRCCHTFCPFTIVLSFTLCREATPVLQTTPPKERERSHPGLWLSLQGKGATPVLQTTPPEEGKGVYRLPLYRGVPVRAGCPLLFQKRCSSPHGLPNISII